MRAPHASKDDFARDLPVCPTLTRSCPALCHTVDDELFQSVEGDEGADSTQLDYDEFLEVVGRVCHQKLPPHIRLEPFEESLDKWLGLLFLPAVKAKGRR